MLSLFSIPKPFRDHVETIQRNAIQSWTLLRPRPEIILLGDEEGTAEIAKEFNLRHIPTIARNGYGTPLVSDMFETAQRVASHNLLCYVNADIILMSDFMPALEQVARHRDRFLVVGQRWDLEVTEPLVLGTDWERRFRNRVAKNGELHPHTGIDYFVFPRGLWGEIPSFAIGRTAWDNWLLYEARCREADLIDATQVVMAVHQEHDYVHLPEGTRSAWKGPEAARNLELCGGYDRVFTIQDANLVLTAQGLAVSRAPEHLRRARETWPLLNCPPLHAPWKALWRFCALVEHFWGLVKTAAMPRHSEARGEGESHLS